MKHRNLFLSLLTLLILAVLPTRMYAAGSGIVNFSTCISESKYGQQEQEAFDDVRNKITSIMTDLEGQLNDIATKLQDPEFIDSLSPEAEQEMKARFQSLSEELGRYQNQYYQVMNQANMKLIQMMSNHVAEASEAIAKKQKLNVILNKEACFYYDPKQDITTAVVSEMNKNFEKDAKSQQTTTAAAEKSSPTDQAQK